MNSAKFFTDFEPYYETIAHVDLRMRVLGMDEPRYSILQTTVGQLGVQWAKEGSGQLSEGATDRSAFGLYMQLNSLPRLLNGMILDPNAIVVLPPGAEFCFSCDHANSWLALRVPTELLTDSGAASHDTLINSVSVVRSCHDLSQKLRTTVLGYLRAINRTQSLSNSTLVSSLFGNEILTIARKVCHQSAGIQLHSENKFSALSQRYADIAKTAAEIIENSLDGSVSVAAISKSLSVSERTLLTAFRSRFEMPPRRFIQSMRLNRARTILRQSTHPETFIQDVAAECGFWDVGRFASRYSELFGELPSQTLRR
ncbi:HTH-type transcriptional activator RhaS [Symmachiella macrocystis]|uniref:HTH-type transcriptional activator RhaS n=1 Tax=Symmachiella macrocystis TaxID=2527985 RepID=A0A5C6AWV1_9PLAN|nr:helix-turn-helix domain-containing protein [Symmachiella macrocystis]TWU04220.1 HTH-type transcriptional activator RhaS [Symmachiella macrocystis]